MHILICLHRVLRLRVSYLHRADNNIDNYVIMQGYFIQNIIKNIRLNVEQRRAGNDRNSELDKNLVNSQHLLKMNTT